MKKTNLNDALLKRAMGFETSDVVEEFSAQENGELKLTKRKVTKKTIPPDISALKTLAELRLKESDYSSLTDEQLEKERERLITQIKNLNDKEEQIETEEK